MITTRMKAGKMILTIHKSAQGLIEKTEGLVAQLAKHRDEIDPAVKKAAELCEALKPLLAELKPLVAKLGG